jgi:hypothetical protein
VDFEFDLLMMRTGVEGVSRDVDDTLMHQLIARLIATGEGADGPGAGRGLRQEGRTGHTMEHSVGWWWGVGAALEGSRVEPCH